MTISSGNRKVGPYTGNSVTTNFSFDFRVFDNSEIQVVFTDALNVETVLVLDSDYSVTLNEEQSTNPGGYITYPHPESDPMPDNLSASEKLTLLGNAEYTQEVNIQNQGGFYPEVFENALDKLTMLIQQVKGVADRSIVVPVSSTVEPEDYLTTINQYKLDAEAALAALEESIGTDIQAQLESGTNIKTINGESVLGAGDLVVSATVEDGDKGDIVVSGGVWSLESAINTAISLGVTAYSWGNHASAGYLTSGAIGSSVQAYSLVLANTTASFTTADETKLDGIAAGAEVNVNADWTAVSGDAQILNKPTLGTLAALSSINDGNWSGADLSVSNGGTGASSASAARTNLGVAIGSDVQAYDATIVKTGVANTFTATQTFKGLGETVAAISGTSYALSVSDGTILTWTLTANSTLTDSLSSGQSVELNVDDGTNYTISYPTITWVTNGGVAPTLKTTGVTKIVFEKVGSVLYGARIGDA